MFIKEPRPGAVKTRLAAAVGDAAAARLYEQWASSILEALQPVRNMANIIGYYAGAELGVRGRWHRFADDWWGQPDGDLGARLAAGFSRALVLGPAIAIGTDCLDVDADLVEAAFDALGTADSVLGPATDGGYYLIGLRRDAPGVFDNIEWSSERTFIQQRDALQRAGMTVALLPPLRDIDTIDDWTAYQRRRGCS